MSGGSYDYAYSMVNQFASDLRLSTPLRKAFKKHLKRVAEAMKAVEWVDSGDCSEPHGDKAIRKVLINSFGNVNIQKRTVLAT